MKNGGADIRVLHREPAGNRVVAHMRGYVSSVLGKARPPDAYAAVAFWIDPETPGRPSYDVTFFTMCNELPAPLLVRMAGAFLVDEHAAYVGRCQAVEAMGYEVGDWTPDDAS